MSPPNSESKSQRQDNLVKDTTVSGDFTFAPQQIQTYIETQIVEISTEKVTQKELKKSSPYKGLKRFNFGDREYFFGRDALIAKLFNVVNKSSFSLILGASGSGKSSVIRAGLIPELKKSLESNKFYHFIFHPNQDPFESLHRCLLSDVENYQFSESEAKIALKAKTDTLSEVIKKLKKEDEKWLIFVDQFEQLFTICTDLEKRKNFIEGIIQVAKKRDSSVRIILAMRADFLEQFSFYPNLGEIANQNNMHLVTEMYSDELRQAIEQPAAKHGVVFEKGLVEQIIKEVEGQSAYLPLLEYTLNLLWTKECTTEASDGRPHIEDRTLNTTNYAALQGVRGALQKRVDEIYKDICKKNEDGELATKQIFLKLVNIVESDSGSRAVSRRAYRSEFVGESIENILKKFIDENLLVSSYEYLSEEQLLPEDSKKIKKNATIEIAHEILLSSWDKLKHWLEEEKEAIILKNWLATETRRWLEIRADDKSKANDELLKGSRLDQIVEFREKKAFEKFGGLVQVENEFIDTSVDWRNRLKKEQNTTKVFQLERQAAKILDEVKEQDVYGSRGKGIELLSAAIEIGQELHNIVKDDCSLDKKYPTINPLKALHQVNSKFRDDPKLRDIKEELVVFQGHQDGVTSVSFSPDGKTIVSASRDKTVRLWDRETGEELARFQGHKRDVTSVSFSPDGKTIASASRDKTVRLWDRETGEELARFQGHKGWIFSVSYAPNGKTIAYTSGDTVRILNRKTEKELAVFQDHQSEVFFVNYAPEGKLLASASRDKTVRLWHKETGEELAVFQGHKSLINSLSFSPKGKLLASASRDKTVRIWKVEGLKELLERSCNRLKEYGCFIDNPNELDRLKICQVSFDKIFGASALIKIGEKLAKEGDTEKAIEKLQAALKWNPQLDFDVEERVKQLANSISELNN